MTQSFVKFYGSDWRSDAGLRLCSLAARGLWIEIIALMMDAEPFGHLVINGKPATAKTLAAVISAPEKTVAAALAELEANGVFSKTDEGVIYSRRMLRDLTKQKEARENGRRGGNPALKGTRITDTQSAASESEVNPPDKLARAFQKPEARSQKPDMGGEGLAEVGHVIRAFDELRAHFWPEQRRAYPAADDGVTAGRWIADGLPFDTIRDVFETRMAAMSRGGKPPPGTLRYLDAAVRSAGGRAA